MEPLQMLHVIIRCEERLQNAPIAGQSLECANPQANHRQPFLTLGAAALQEFLQGSLDLSGAADERRCAVERQQILESNA